MKRCLSYFTKCTQGADIQKHIFKLYTKMIILFKNIFVYHINHHKQKYHLDTNF